MDLGGNTNTATATAATAAAAATVKTPEAETETPTPTRIQHAKPLSFSSNGVLKRHNPLHHQRSFGNHHHHHAVVVTYKECLKNHAASLGGHAVDGCGEFMPSPTTAANPTLLKCAACGCHRNFHRREPEETPTLPAAAAPKAKAALEYQSHHRHHPPPPPNHGSGGNSSPNSPSPPPISSTYYPSAPHMLLALSTAFSGPPTDSNNNPPISATANPSGRKRFRTKFTQDQKDRMLEFAEKVGWKIQKRDEELINEFCTQTGVEKGVLKVWMHNNKNNFCKKDQSNTAPMDFHIASRNNHNIDTNSNTNAGVQFNLHQDSSNDSQPHIAAVNGSSPSS